MDGSLDSSRDQEKQPTPPGGSEAKDSSWPKPATESRGHPPMATAKPESSNKDPAQELEQVDFPQAVLDEVPSIVRSCQLAPDRELTRALAIDPFDAHILDDGINLRWNKNTYRVSVSVPDFSDLIDLHSALDVEARRRVVSYHNGDQMVPIFPNQVRKHLCLHAHRPCPTLTITTTLNRADLEIIDVDVRETRVQDPKTLSYRRSDRILENRKHPLHKMLREAHFLAKNLACKRKNTEVRSVDSHGMVKEFMILTNQAVASWFIANNRRAVFRHLAHSGAAQAGRPRYRYVPYNCPDPISGFEPYARLTSPLQRYPDFLNLRIAKSIIHDQEPPFSGREIREFISHANERLMVLSRTLRAVEVRREILVLLDQPEKADWSHVGRSRFSRVLQFVLTHNSIPLGLQQEIVRRVEKDRLGTRDLIEVLFSTPDTECWRQIRRTITEYFSENHTRVPQDIAGHLKDTQTRAMSYTYSRTQTEDAWVRTVRFSIDDQVFTQKFSGNYKFEPHQKAFKAILEWYFLRFNTVRIARTG